MGQISTLPLLDTLQDTSPITGNTAKVKVLQELSTLLAGGTIPRILDIGCVGPSPMQFWEQLLGRFAFQLVGVDVWGIEEATMILAQRGWEGQVSLRHGSGYSLNTLFEPESFDWVVATQVLEHVAQLPMFMNQVATALKPGGMAWFTLDSAHWRSRYDLREPVRLLKNVAKRGLSMFGNERHFDLPWHDHEVASACRAAGLEVMDVRYYNLAPLKFLHNRLVPDERKNQFMRMWFEMEEFINDVGPVRAKARHLFLGIFVHVRKSEVERQEG